MAKIHVLRAGANNTYQAVVHDTTPAGTNSAGFSWSSVLVAAGVAKSVMSVGSAPGQITQAEMDSIKAGTTLEASFIWQDDPSMTNAQRIADLDLRASQMIADMQAKYAADYKFFGYTRT